MTERFGWHMPVAIAFGPGAALRIPDDLGERACVVLAFDAATALGLERAWRTRLGSRLLDWIPVPPGLPTLQQLRTLAPRLWTPLEIHHDAVVIGLGGGAVMDLAKLLRGRPLDHDAEQLVQSWRSGRPGPRRQRAPLWLVPTTAGTGSEVTRWATVWDTDNGAALRRQIDAPDGWAERAYVDPQLSATCPPQLLRDAALDALGRALEAIWNLNASPLSDRLALTAARQIIGALPDALADPDDAGVRCELALAALNAGLAFAQTQDALAHALSHTVALEHGLPHGQACAIWLPAAWRLALGVHPRVDRLLGAVFRCTPADGAARLEQWLAEVGVDPTPSAHAVHDAPRRIAAVLASERGSHFITGRDRMGREAA